MVKGKSVISHNLLNLYGNHRFQILPCNEPVEDKHMEVEILL